ncbi:MAG: hypothetical protein K2I44_00310, partial [Muribaculaceae bacterium]|nr:hypothetical protein [Muribaculaceae bacterium]
MILKNQLISAFILTLPLSAAAESRWTMNTEGGITWNVTESGDKHSAHIEMSGNRVAPVLR